MPDAKPPIYCRICGHIAEQELTPSYFRCLFCGSDTTLLIEYEDPEAPGWDCPFEKKGEVYWATTEFRLASIVGKQFDTVIAGSSVLDFTVGWRQLLVELVKLTKHNGFLHIEMARPGVEATPTAYQAIAPCQFGREIKPLGLDIINQQFTADRQAYWLQKMDEVFSL